ncbi:copper chaperone PCu(A)C [Thalassococcus sp. S3]|uniref:copper chaperone PCu(A)C n=1 Tax=Thalassococcus sp. S3 TaxID=2017482 RepID=UPI0010245F88|nr:copper chaperone PCu(A)C [Thalassococcus sp. S3]QBF31017.1 copper-binding protein [Thalassococcus sp. S3]
MPLKKMLATATATLLAVQAYAEDMTVSIVDPYARASTAMSASGAAFMGISNTGTEDDRLIAATSDVSERVELHTHLEDPNGVMRMIEVEDGFFLPAGETHMLQRGGDHIMFLGIKEPFEQGDMIDVTLTFEKAGQMSVQIPVDLERQDGHGGHGG